MAVTNLILYLVAVVAVVAMWRGLWGLMDIYLWPNNPKQLGFFHNRLRDYGSFPCLHCAVATDYIFKFNLILDVRKQKAGRVMLGHRRENRVNL